jgi:glycosyltransferase involved in cell wall biosynthesis
MSERTTRPAAVVERSNTHLVLIPSYNPGGIVYETVRGAREFWDPVWVVVDGSTDGTAEGLRELAQADAGLRVLVLPKNRGKGAAVLHGIVAAGAEGFTHALTMDSDAQHPPSCIPEFMARSIAEPASIVLGVPVFDASAPRIRVQGRKLSNWWTSVETVGREIGDSLYGFRVYPIADLAAVMRVQPWMRRFDFDPEAAVRLVWRGLKPINIRAPVRYLKREEGGVSHFNYYRDNALLTFMHTRLVVEFVLRLPFLLWRKAARSSRRSRAGSVR